MSASKWHRNRAQMGPTRVIESSALPLGNSIAKVLVGDDEEPFHVHRNLLTTSSDFFNKALKGDFKEKDGQVKLQDCSPAVFEIYIQWLYTSKMPTASPVKPTEELALKLVKELDLIADCIILADLIQDDGFFNSGIDCLIEASTRHWLVNLSAKFYNGLPPASPAIQLMVDLWAYQGHVSWFNTLASESGPKDFWFAVSKALTERLAADAKKWTKLPWEADPCKYHKHAADDRC